LPWLLVIGGFGTGSRSATSFFMGFTRHNQTNVRIRPRPLPGVNSIHLHDNPKVIIS
jgi:hypothetical protein